MFVRLWGPLALSALVAGDAASDVIQLGGVFASYNLRYETWLEEREAWDKEHNEQPAHTEPQRADDVPADDWRDAKIDDWRAIAARMNGNRASCDADAVRAALNEHHLRPPSDSTVNRWAQRARDGEL